MDSIKTNMEIISEELNEAALLYKKIQLLKAELTEANSVVNLTELENENLKQENDQLKSMIRKMNLSKPE